MSGLLPNPLIALLSRFRRSAPRFSGDSLRQTKELSGRSVGLPTRTCLAKALAYLDHSGRVVTLDGDPLCYEIDGQPSTESEIVALAFQLGMRSPQ